MSTSVTLDEFLNRDGDHINQVVYKVDGNFNGNITGDNVTVILMGDGNINGNINARDGEIVLIRGDINGDVKANKVICPTKPEETSEKKKGVYHGKGSVIVKCPICGELYPQNISMRCTNIQDFTANVDITIDAEEDAKKTLSHNPAKDVKSTKLPTKNAHKTCYECIHCQHNTNAPMCKLTNQIIRWWTPCTYYERRYR